jgi:hypothetical protein
VFAPKGAYFVRERLLPTEPVIWALPTRDKLVVVGEHMRGRDELYMVPWDDGAATLVVSVSRQLGPNRLSARLTNR